MYTHKTMAENANTVYFISCTFAQPISNVYVYEMYMYIIVRHLLM